MLENIFEEIRRASIPILELKRVDVQTGLLESHVFEELEQNRQMGLLLSLCWHSSPCHSSSSGRSSLPSRLQMKVRPGILLFRMCEKRFDLDYRKMCHIILGPKLHLGWPAFGGQYSLTHKRGYH